MKLSSFFAPKRLLSLALPALATLFVLSLFAQSTAQAADKGYITAKTWVDSATGRAAYGDGIHDDTKNLQDMITYGISKAEAIQLEPGIYKLTQTLHIVNTVLTDQKSGFRMSGIGGPDMSPFIGNVNNGGVSLVMDASAGTGPLAILEVDQGAFYDMTIENIGMSSNVPTSIINGIVTPGTKYGVLFGGQNFSHAVVHMVTIQNVSIAFAIDPQLGIPAGGNGEQVDLDECKVFKVNCFYYNNGANGQALGHSIAKCGGILYNGASFVRLGYDYQEQGQVLDITSTLATFIDGPLRNTLIECDSCPANVNVTGGRIEQCNTLLTYNGGTYAEIGGVVIRGMNFDATNIYQPTPGSNPTVWATKAFPLIDGTLNGRIPQNWGEQYTNTIEQCRINGGNLGPFPALSLVGVNGDLSRTYFDRCTFAGFSNLLTDPNRIDPVLDANLAALNVKVTQCRANIGQPGSVPFTDISYP